MALVIGDSELLLDDFGDAAASPDLAPKAVGFRPVPQKVGDESNLIRIKLGGVAGAGSREQSSGTFIARFRDPLADSSFCDAKSSGDMPLLPAELDELPSAHPSPFPQL
jgi:hypothetical protein